MLSSSSTDDHQLFILFVDMCLQRVQGDLASSASLTWWMDRIRTGLVCGAGGGWPCESYSVARLLEGGPPPVRSGTWPEGIPNIPLRAWHQVMVGSRLIRFILDAFLTLVLMNSQYGLITWTRPVCGPASQCVY